MDTQGKKENIVNRVNKISNGSLTSTWYVWATANLSEEIQKLSVGIERKERSMYSKTRD